MPTNSVWPMGDTVWPMGEGALRSLAIQYRQDARPPVPWRHNVEGADKHNTRDIDQHKGVRGQCAAHGGASERAAARRGGLSRTCVRLRVTMLKRVRNVEYEAQRQLNVYSPLAQDQMVLWDEIRNAHVPVVAMADPRRLHGVAGSQPLCLVQPSRAPSRTWA